MMQAAELRDFDDHAMLHDLALNRTLLFQREMRTRSVPRHRFTYLNSEYSIAEALLWLGIYLAINLQLSSGNLLGHWWGGSRTTTEFSRPFYWATWVLIWGLPPAVLACGLRRKDRFVIAVGAIAEISR